MAQGGSALRALLALGASLALAACASSSRVEEGATPVVAESAMVADAAEKTGGAPYVTPKPSVKPAPASQAPTGPAPVVAAKPPEPVPAAKPEPDTVVAEKPATPSPAQNVNLTKSKPAEPPMPKQLIGLNRDEVQSLLGFPWLLKREGTAELWQYRVTSCVLDLFLLGADPGDLKVSHVELRSRRENKPPTVACYVDILNTPRPAPNQTAKGGIGQPSS